MIMSFSTILAKDLRKTGSTKKPLADILVKNSAGLGSRMLESTLLAFTSFLMNDTVERLAYTWSSGPKSASAFVARFNWSHNALGPQFPSPSVSGWDGDLPKPKDAIRMLNLATDSGSPELGLVVAWCACKPP